MARKILLRNPIWKEKKSERKSTKIDISADLYCSTLKLLLAMYIRVRDISSPVIWATIWRRSHGRQKRLPNGLIKLIN